MHNGKERTNSSGTYLENREGAIRAPGAVHLRHQPSEKRMKSVTTVCDNPDYGLIWAAPHHGGDYGYGYDNNGGDWGGLGTFGLLGYGGYGGYGDYGDYGGYGGYGGHGGYGYRGHGHGYYDGYGQNGYGHHHHGHHHHYY
ncbi:keratin-associated protein 19-2-like [Hyposmocoma kahamanoa]|uniref:keratin-associated protein 19-2-like n=1 Tax=Hyposmocoma kahamanoa TaxID=1477025 RepID=UPI000E6D69F7|nr:keratin-associated protein 19-2-like [Hyposmocoma kahamanoa]